MTAPGASGAAAKFTIEALESGKAKTAPEAKGQRMRSLAVDDPAIQPTSPEETIAAVMVVDEEAAIVDRTALTHGALIAASPDYVDLSWREVPGATSYVVTKDNSILAAVSETTYRDVAVASGDEPIYQIQPVMTGAIQVEESQSWGLTTTVPEGNTAQALEVEAADQAAEVMAAAALSKASVAWNTFIPENRIKSPGTKYCNHDSTHTYNGNNRGWASGFSTNSKTAIIAHVQFSKGMTGSSKHVGPTYAYNKAGKQVASAQASSAGLTVKQLGRSATSVDLRFNISAAHPMCKKLPVHGSITGAMTISVTASGNWSITSGNYRRMPNHEIFVGRADGKAAKVIHRESYANALCLVGAATCDLRTMTGFYGTY